jgi:probable rRNA maturation factor
MIVLDSHINDREVKRTLKGVSPRALERFAGRAGRAAGLRGEVHVLVTSSRAVRALNRQFRKKNKATDVLSFPPFVEGTHGGDIAISAEIAAQQACALGHSLAQELKVLMLHGMLHLAGYDHERDHGEMARTEERLRRRLGLGLGVIQRASIQKSSMQKAGAKTRIRSRKTKRTC